MISLFIIPILLNWHLTIQSGSYSGSTAVGIGITQKYYSSDILIGYTKQKYGADIYNLSWSNNIETQTKYKLYGGIAALVSLLDSETFVTLPSQYPSGYYSSNAIMFSPQVGIKTKLTNNLSGYFQISTISYYTEVYVRSNFQLPIESLFSAGGGLNYHFN